MCVLILCKNLTVSNLYSLRLGSSGVSGSSTIAGLAVLCIILIMLVVVLAFGFGLCCIARKRTRQADLMTDRLNGKPCQSSKAKSIYTVCSTRLCADSDCASSCMRACENPPACVRVCVHVNGHQHVYMSMPYTHCWHPSMD